MTSLPTATQGTGPQTPLSPEQLGPGPEAALLGLTNHLQGKWLVFQRATHFRTTNCPWRRLRKCLRQHPRPHCGKALADGPTRTGRQSSVHGHCHFPESNVHNVTYLFAVCAFPHKGSSRSSSRVHVCTHMYVYMHTHVRVHARTRTRTLCHPELGM